MSGHGWERRNRRPVFGWVAYRCASCREYAFVRARNLTTAGLADETCPRGEDA